MAFAGWRELLARMGVLSEIVSLVDDGRGQTRVVSELPVKIDALPSPSGSHQRCQRKEEQSESCPKLFISTEQLFNKSAKCKLVHQQFVQNLIRPRGARG